MKIAIAAATRFEISPLIEYIEQSGAASQHELTPLITGVGMVATTYQVAAHLLQTPVDCILQAGIGGSFSNKFALAEVVIIGQETIGDMGVQEAEFQDIFDMGFAQADQYPFTAKSLVNPFIKTWGDLHLPVARGLTVNEITTDSTRIRTLEQKYGCEIESMEGAAFHYVCLHHSIPFLQLRSVSNHVGERDKKKWKLRGSIEALNTALIRIVQQIIAT